MAPYGWYAIMVSARLTCVKMTTTQPRACEHIERASRLSTIPTAAAVVKVNDNGEENSRAIDEQGGCGYVRYSMFFARVYRPITSSLARSYASRPWTIASA